MEKNTVFHVSTNVTENKEANEFHLFQGFLVKSGHTPRMVGRIVTLYTRNVQLVQL